MPRRTRLPFLFLLASLPGFSCFAAGAAESPAPVAHAEVASANAALERRVADLEAAMTNVPVSAPSPGALSPERPMTGVAAPGHNGFMMINGALVLFMTLPGLFLFYGGLVRTKNVLSVAGQCFGLAGMTALLWWAFGYSLVFGRSFEGTALAPFLGGTEFLFLRGVTSAPNADYAPWVSQNVFAMYQLMFAIITPALIFGAVAERMKFGAVMLFSALWMVFVYFPMAHMVWGATGLMNGVWNASAAIPAIDFAGGTVVHMTSGWSALLLCVMVGRRNGFGRRAMAPHSMVLCVVGTGMLWVGWYGFNAGSALAADGVAANAFTTTTLAAGAAAFAWGMAEWAVRGHASVLGFCSGALAGLVVITPAAGFCTAGAAVGLALVAALAAFAFVTYAKKKLKLDDSLDAFGVHGVCGTLGALLVGFVADASANPNLAGEAAVKNGLSGLVEHGGLWWVQLKAMSLTVCVALAATALIALLVKRLIGLRAGEEAESQGLDIADHGEEGYSFNA